METWILTILALRPKLDSAARLYTRKAESEALNLTDDVLTVCARLEEINDKKRRIVNMKVLSDRIGDALEDEDRMLLNEYTANSAAEIALKRGEGRTRVYRRIKTALAKAVRTLERFGFDSETMQKDYFDIPLCKRMYEKIKRGKNKTHRAEYVAMPARTDAPALTAAV